MDAAGVASLIVFFYPFNLPVCPRMERTYQAMFDAMSMVDHAEPVWLVGFCSASLSELRTVVWQHGVGPIR